MTHPKEQSRDQRQQLLELLYQYDIASLISSPDQIDEYDCLVDPLLRLLRERATELEIRVVLEQQVRTHFGSFDCTRARESAGKVKAWYDEACRESPAKQQGLQ